MGTWFLYFYHSHRIYHAHLLLQVDNLNGPGPSLQPLPVMNSHNLSVLRGVNSTSIPLPSGNIMAEVTEATTTLGSSQLWTSSSGLPATSVSQSTSKQISPMSHPKIQDQATLSLPASPAQMTTAALPTVATTSAINVSPSTVITMQSSPIQFSSYMPNLHTDTFPILSPSTALNCTQQSLAPNTTTVSPEVAKKTRISNSYTLVLCPCKCTSDLSWIANITKEEQEGQVKEIVQTLQVNKSSISKTLRKKTSAQDSRTTSAYYGSFITGLVFVFVVSIVIVPDFLNVVHYLYGAIKQTT